jgi:hypothetical protein
MFLEIVDIINSGIDIDKLWRATCDRPGVKIVRNLLISIIS